MGNPFPNWFTLLLRVEEVRLDFIRTDLGVCSTFADIVEREYTMGNWDHAERTLAVTEKGYSTVLRLLSQARGLRIETEDELQTTLKHLRERLDRLKRKYCRSSD